MSQTYGPFWTRGPRVPNGGPNLTTLLIVGSLGGGFGYARWFVVVGSRTNILEAFQEIRQ